MTNEFELEKVGIEMVEKKQLWAGVVFTKPSLYNSDTLPEFVQYKIRMDADKVDSNRFVEDRIPRPTPRRRPPIDLKYLYFGFSFLQVRIFYSILLFIQKCLK